MAVTIAAVLGAVVVAGAIARRPATRTVVNAPDNRAAIADLEAQLATARAMSDTTTIAALEAQLKQVTQLKDDWKNYAQSAEGMNFGLVPRPEPFAPGQSAHHPVYGEEGWAGWNP